MSSDKCIVTIIDSLQDYLRYKESCKRREREIKEYKQSEQQEDNGLLMVAEAECDAYPRLRKSKNSIPIIDIIEYIEDLDPPND